jgi:hypothetical protein
MTRQQNAGTYVLSCVIVQEFGAQAYIHYYSEVRTFMHNENGSERRAKRAAPRAKHTFGKPERGQVIYGRKRIDGKRCKVV